MLLWLLVCSDHLNGHLYSPILMTFQSYWIVKNPQLTFSVKAMTDAVSHGDAIPWELYLWHQETTWVSCTIKWNGRVTTLHIGERV